MEDHNHIDSQTFELLMDRLRSFSEVQDRIEKKVDGGFEKINGRVRKLENWRWYVIGVSVALVAIVKMLVG